MQPNNISCNAKRYGMQLCTKEGSVGETEAADIGLMGSDFFELKIIRLLLEDNKTCWQPVYLRRDFENEIKLVMV